MHAKFWVDNCELVHAHFARTHCVSKTRRGKSGKFSDLFGARLRPWNEFTLAQAVESMPISEFTRGFDGSHDGRKIVIRAEIVAVDYGGILEVGAGQADRTSARRLHKSWRDCERVWWR